MVSSNRGIWYFSSVHLIQKIVHGGWDKVNKSSVHTWWFEDMRSFLSKWDRSLQTFRRRCCVFQFRPAPMFWQCERPLTKRLHGGHETYIVDYVYEWWQRRDRVMNAAETCSKRPCVVLRPDLRRCVDRIEHLASSWNVRRCCWSVVAAAEEEEEHEQNENSKVPDGFHEDSSGVVCEACWNNYNL